MAGWIGVDLDGTLAHFDRWRGPMHIGLPIPAMAKRVHDWHSRGVEVRIFTARASRPELIPDVEKWLQRHGFPPLAVTNQKDFGMLELWDDRAIQVLYNTGKAVRPNKLEGAEKAELFDPDVVYADDEEKNKEVQPTANEVENFKRSIKASTDQSIHSLGDLLDALDEGEDYTPGEAAVHKEDDLAEVHETTSTSESTDPFTSEEEQLDNDLPLSANGFVSHADDTGHRQPKNAIVEIELDDLDMGPDFDEEETNREIEQDTTAELPIAATQIDVVLEAPIAEDESSNPDFPELPHSPVESTSSSPDDTLDNQPISHSDTPSSLDEDFGQSLTAAMDDMQDDLTTPNLIATAEKTFQNTPTLTAFPEDELDDFEDLPALKVERR